MKEIKIFRGEDSEIDFGIEKMNIGYAIDMIMDKDHYMIKIICELQLSKNITIRKKPKFQFLLLDIKGRIIGSCYRTIQDRKEFYCENVFDIYTYCAGIPKNLGGIKYYVRPENP